MSFKFRNGKVLLVPYIESNICNCAVVEGNGKIIIVEKYNNMWNTFQPLMSLIIEHKDEDSEIRRSILSLSEINYVLDNDLIDKYVEFEIGTVYPGSNSIIQIPYDDIKIVRQQDRIIDFKTMLDKGEGFGHLTKEQAKNLGEMFEKDFMEASQKYTSMKEFPYFSYGMLWGKPFDGVEIYALPVTGPWYEFEFRNPENDTRFRYRVTMFTREQEGFEIDWYLINQEMLHKFRLFKYMF